MFDPCKSPARVVLNIFYLHQDAPKKTACHSESLDQDIYTSTLPATNIAPENRSSQKENNLPTINFQGLC